MNFYHSIGFKLLLLLLLLVIVPSLIIGGLFLGELRNKTRQQSRHILEQEFKQAVIRFDEILFDIESYAPSVYTNKELVELIGSIDPAMKDYELLKISNDLRSNLFTKTIDNKYISSLELKTGSTGDHFSSDHQRVMIHSDFEESLIDRWVVSKDNRDFTYLSLHKKIRDFGNERNPGTVTFNVAVKHLQDRLNEYISEKYSVFVYTADNKPVLSLRSDHQLLSDKILTALSSEYEVFLPFSSKGNRYYGFSYRSPHSQLLYIAVLPKEALFGDLKYLWQLSLFSILTVLCIVTLGIVTGTRGLIRDIDALSDGLQRFGEGDLKFSIKTRRRDELGKIITNVNDMATNIQILIDEVYRKEVLRKEIQLKAIQIEINEHFLYNTLDLVRWMCDEGKSEEASLVVEKLSSYFRYSLSSGHDIIPVSSVIKSLESYSEIIALRFEDRFFIKIELADDIQDQPVLKHLFQPILENAVIHGVEPLYGRGMISIRFFREGKNLCFSCIDNGMGIEDDVLDRLVKEINKAEDANSLPAKDFSLINIARQIRLHYGDEGSIRINSNSGKGTRIILKLPDSQNQ